MTGSRTGKWLTYGFGGVVAFVVAGDVWAQSDGTIYRCHSAKDGALIFQDRPCNKVPGTQEAARNAEGTVVPPAPPPAEDGAATAERYGRYLDSVAADREAQKAADLAEAARLRAKADTERSVQQPSPAPSAGVCTLIGSNDECLAYGPDYGYGGYSGYSAPGYPPYRGGNRRPPIEHRPPPPPPTNPPPAAKPGPRIGGSFRPGFGKTSGDESSTK